MTEFAKNLKTIRNDRKMNQHILAKALGYGYTSISNYESGRSEPSLNQLLKIAKCLNVTTDELIGAPPVRYPDESAYQQIDCQFENIRTIIENLKTELDALKRNISRI